VGAAVGVEGLAAESGGGGVGAAVGACVMTVGPSGMTTVAADVMAGTATLLHDESAAAAAVLNLLVKPVDEVDSTREVRLLAIVEATLLSLEPVRTWKPTKSVGAVGAAVGADGAAVGAVGAAVGASGRQWELVWGVPVWEGL